MLKLQKIVGEMHVLKSGETLYNKIFDILANMLTYILTRFVWEYWYNFIDNFLFFPFFKKKKKDNIETRLLQT